MITQKKQVRRAVILACLGLLAAATLLGCTQTTILTAPSSGIDANVTLVKDVDILGTTVTYCDLNYSRGLLVAQNCVS